MIGHTRLVKHTLMGGGRMGTREDGGGGDLEHPEKVSFDRGRDLA